MNESILKVSFSRKVLRRTLDVVLLPIAAVLLLVKILFKITFFRVNSSRFGHLASDTEVLLRRMKLGIMNNNLKYVGIAAKDISNKQLLRMFQRRITILQLPQPRFLRSLTKEMATASILSKFNLFRSYPSISNEFYEFNQAPPSLQFTAEEEEQGQELLRQLSIAGWFVCFHSRDSAHLDKFLRKGDAAHDFRNCSIENYLKAAEYLAQQGGYAVRMGSTVSTKMNHHQKIIDYAGLHRSDFGDIYLATKCKFFLGNTSGISSVSYIFNVPVANANVIPITKGPPPGQHDLFIPKKVWSVREQRLLTFREMILSPLLASWQYRQFRKEDDLVPVENTAEEILDLALEMNERLDGTWKATPEDEELQQKFKSLFPADSACHGFPSRVGTKFLRQHQELL